MSDYPEADRRDDSHADDDNAAADVDPKGAERRPDKARKDELLDEGIEETFPASDPVAVKHIT